MTPLELVRRFHQQTKHHPHAYARSLGYLDWDAQPDPFRSYDGARRVWLDEVPATPAPAWDALFGDSLPPRALDAASLSQLLYDSLALSAWKEAGKSRWALRVNPSSGNLHPTEAYLVTGPIEGVCERPILAHYAPKDHVLEVRAELPSAWDALAPTLPAGAFLVGLSSIPWREAWKYGERAFRYCQHDVGHAIGALAIAAAAQGWEVRLLEGVRDDELAALLGLSDQGAGPEPEHPDTLVAVFARGAPFDAAAWRLPAEALAAVKALSLAGTPNRLSTEHQPWPIIDEVGEATRRTEIPTLAPRFVSPVAEPFVAREVPARPIIRQRRSAVSMDGHTSISRDDFYRMLWRTLPAGPVFSALPWRPAVHLAVFVHRVEGLRPGLYLLVREPSDEADLRARLRPTLTWERAAGAPDGLPLYRLATTPAGDAARFVSCQQDIAADGAFALGMVASFGPRLEAEGAWLYRRLFWETGAIGQVLYDEAEAAGVRATGIGCFFDDVMHEVLGFTDDRFQSLYHFTVGGPVDDERLRTLPPYAHRGSPPRG